MDAFNAEFKMVVIADSLDDALSNIRVWRSLATAAGFETGVGRVSVLNASDLTYEVTQALEKARAKHDGPATRVARECAIEGLASHVAGDVDFARELVESIERETGPLRATVARMLTDARKPAEAPPGS